MADDQHLIDLLPRAVVRVDVAGVVSGTAFYVAPGHLLTCHHVIDAAKGRLDLITLVDTSRPDQPVLPLVAPPRSDEVHDVALLRTTPGSDPPVAMLGESIHVDDALATYGYTPAKPGGTPGTFDVEGIEAGPPPLAKFKAGVVQPGMSGAPVLNRRTGLVCGILKRTRDRDAPTGGLAIPIESALRLFPQLRLDNSSATQKDLRWRDSMSVDQQMFLQKFARIAAAGAPSGEIVVSIGQESDRWTVLTEAVPPEGEDWGSKKLVDLNVLRQDVARLLRLLRARDRLKPAEQSKLLGVALAKTLWDEDAQRRIVEMLERPAGALNISILVDEAVDEDLKYLPWEQLAVPHGRSTIRLASNDRSTLTRIRAADVRTVEPCAEPVTVTLVMAPGEPGQERQMKRFGDSLVELLKNAPRKPGRLPSPASPRVTALALTSAMAAGPADIVHYVGFGQYEDGHDALQLDGSPEDRFEYLGGDDLARCFRHAPPRLVVLQPYKVSETEVPVDFTTLAPALLDVGVEAVLAFPLPVDPEASLVFFKTFYEQVLAGASLRFAAQIGRVELDNWRRPWAFPALLSSQPGDVFLAPRSGGSPVPGGKP